MAYYIYLYCLLCMENLHEKKTQIPLHAVELARANPPINKPRGSGMGWVIVMHLTYICGGYLVIDTYIDTHMYIQDDLGGTQL